MQSTVSNENKNATMATVKFGSDTREVSPKKTLREAARLMGVKVGMFSKPNAFVNGAQVTNWNQALKAGDEVEFVKATGRKG